MTKRNFWIGVWVYTVLFILPALAYFLIQFYVYLFDGWQLGEKFGSAAMWLVGGFVGYLFIAMVYDSNSKNWKD